MSTLTVQERHDAYKRAYDALVAFENKHFIKGAYTVCASAEECVCAVGALAKPFNLLPFLRKNNETRIKLIPFNSKIDGVGDFLNSFPLEILTEIQRWNDADYTGAQTRYEYVLGKLKKEIDLLARALNA